VSYSEMPRPKEAVLRRCLGCNVLQPQALARGQSRDSMVRFCGRRLKIGAVAMLVLLWLFQRNGSVTMGQPRTIRTANTRIGIVLRVVRAWPSEKTCRR
jgi:hypothetical protein